MKEYEVTSLIRAIKEAGAPVVLFGAGSYGPLALHALRGFGIEPAYFCDSDEKKHGERFRGIEVISPEALAAMAPGVQVFISSNFLAPIALQLESLKLVDVYDCAALFDAADFSGADVGMDQAEIGRRILTHRNARAILKPSGRLSLRMIDIEITEVCTMKCKDCSNLMQYYTSPKNSDLDLLLRSFDRIARCVDVFNEVRVLGGEPFVNKQIHAIVDHIASFDKVEKIAVFTNATIVPKGANLTCLKHPKVFLDITNYGTLSRNHDKLVEALEAEGISYITHAPQLWTDSAKIEYIPRPPEDLAEMFMKCCVNDILTLLNGRLYRCPFSANAMNLKAIPQDGQDYVDLCGDDEDDEAVKRAIDDLYNNRKYISACNFCNGRDYMTPSVEAAVQTKQVLPLAKIYD